MSDTETGVTPRVKIHGPASVSLLASTAAVGQAPVLELRSTSKPKRRPGRPPKVDTNSSSSKDKEPVDILMFPPSSPSRPDADEADEPSYSPQVWNDTEVVGMESEAGESLDFLLGIITGAAAVWTGMRLAKMLF